MNYPSLQATYTAAVNNDVIQLVSGVQTGTFVAAKPIHVTLAGGYDPSFTTVTGMTTIFGGTAIQQGLISVRNVNMLAPQPLTTTSPLPAYSIATGPINVQFAATGGILPYTFTGAGFTALGFTFSPNGKLSGTPPGASVGNWSIPVTVTDSAPPPVVTTVSFSLNVTL